MANKLEATPETILPAGEQWDEAMGEAPAAQSNGVCQGEILTFVAMHQVIADEQGKIRKRKNLLRRHMKNRGVELKIFDAVVRELEAQDPEQVLEDQSTKNKYRVFMGVPTGETLDMFVRQEQDDATRGKIARQQGFVAGHGGKSLDDGPYEINTIEGQEFSLGWHQGQGELAKGIKTLPPDVVVTPTTVNG